MFLLWLMVLPIFMNADLSAQDENLEDFMAVEDDGTVADEAGAAEPAVAEPGAAEPGEEMGGEDVGEDGGEEGAEEAMPALSANPEELLGEVNGTFRAKKYDDVVTRLADHEDVVDASKDLAEIYLQSLMQSKKPDWEAVNRAAKSLGRQDSSSSLANYAQGLYFQNKKKPDLGRAITFFSKAKSAKKPHPDAAMAYYMAMAKKFWMIGLIVVLLPGAVVVKKIKAKKAAAKAALELNLEPGEGGDIPADAAVQNDLQAVLDAPVSASDKKSKKAKAAKKTKTEAAAETTADFAAETKPEPPAETKPLPAALAKPVKEIPQVEEPPVSEPEPQPEPLAHAGYSPVEPQPEPQPEPQNSQPYMVPQTPETAAPVAIPPSSPPPQQAVYSYSLQMKRAAEIEQAKSMISSTRREPVSADPELDAIWSNLCRKALKSKIAPQVKSSYESLPGDTAKVSLSETPDFSSIDPNVTIDLSEESLKEDLIGKLKMLAITDGELRSLLAQKNPKHVPHLIEYVLSKPEPVRLALVARELGNFTDPAVLDTLAGLLYNEDHRVALAAIQGLENSRNSNAILLICPFLKSDIPLLAQAARTALSNFGAVKILKAFVQLPQLADARIREAGVFVLSRMKGAQVEQLLVQMLNDNDEEIREKVILAMSYQKNPAYIDPLRDFFRIATGPDKTLARKAIVYLQGFVSNRKKT